MLGALSEEQNMKLPDGAAEKPGQDAARDPRRDGQDEEAELPSAEPSPKRREAPGGVGDSQAQAPEQPAGGGRSPPRRAGDASARRIRRRAWKHRDVPSACRRNGAGRHADGREPRM